MTPLAFYTPVKHPYESEPSGDREPGRLLMAALRGLGCAPHLASRLLTYRRAFEPADAARLERLAGLTVARLVARYRRRPPEGRPRAWITYQSIYRAPDLVGPGVATALGIPYVLVDTALSAKSRRTPFRPWVSAARLAVRRADLIFLMSPRDWPRVAECRGARFAAERILELPPAVDLARFEASAERRAACRAALGARFPRTDGPVILAVAAMREAKKLDAYRLLSGALHRLHAAAPDRPWRLAVVGDGPARPAIHAALGAALPSDRTAFLGSLDPDVLPTVYWGADLFAFPGRFHVVYLQAAAAGLPVVACAGPDPDPMVAPGGALLTAPTPDAFAAGVARLLDDAALRTAMGATARRFVAADRTLEAFQRRLAAGLAILGLPCARSTSR
jgi:glycosyltransferase involved in cell wall biosynthesis